MFSRVHLQSTQLIRTLNVFKIKYKLDIIVYRKKKNDLAR